MWAESHTSCGGWQMWRKRFIFQKDVSGQPVLHFFLKWLFCQTLWLIHLIASIWKAEARELPVWGQTVLHMRWFLKTKQTSKIYQTNKNQCPPKKQQIMLEMIESLLIFPYTPPIYSTCQSKINKQKLSKPILNELEAHGSHISYQSWN